MRHVSLRVVDERDIPHASGPCQNRRGSALITAAIMRWTSPDTSPGSSGGDGGEPQIFRRRCSKRRGRGVRVPGSSPVSEAPVFLIKDRLERRLGFLSLCAAGGQLAKAIVAYDEFASLNGLCTIRPHTVHLLGSLPVIEYEIFDTRVRVVDGKLEMAAAARELSQ